MSDLNVRNNGNNNVQQLDNQPQVEENHAPEEMRRAKPSKFLTVLRVIACIFTVGISEGVIALVRDCMPTRTQPDQVNPPNPNMVPNANPQVDQHNTQLGENIMSNTLPQEYKSALEEAAAPLRNQFGNKIIPDDLGKLLESPTSDKKSLNYKLKCLVKESNNEVTPQVLKQQFESLLKEEASYLALREAVVEHTVSGDIKLPNEDVRNVSCAIFEKVGDAAKNITDLASAKNLLAQNPEAKRLLTNQVGLFIISARNTTKVYPEDNPVVQGLNAALNELKAKFGNTLKFNDLYSLLQVKLPGGRPLHSDLTATVTNIYTAESVKKDVMDKLLEMLKTDYLCEAIENKLTQAGLPKEGPVAQVVVSSVISDSNAVQQLYDNANDKKTLDDFIAVQDKLFDRVIAEVKTNITEMENKYLPTANAEVRSIIKKYIPLLPFDNKHKAASEEKLKEMIKYVGKWKNMDAATDFAGYDDINNTVKSDLSYLKGTHAPGEATNTYTDDIYHTLYDDAHRGIYVINGQQVERKTDTVIDKFKTEFSGKDRQFITKLANQRMPAHFLTPMLINVFPGMGAMKTDGKLLTDEERDSGYIHYRREHINLADDPTSELQEKKGDQVYTIETSADKKTGTLTYTRRQYFRADVKPEQKTLGAVDLTVKINFTLSAGSENGVPFVNNIEFGQKFTDVK
jgi:hypothetical protein